MSNSKSNYEFTVKYTKGFLKFLSDDSIVNQNEFTIQSLFEIYIDYIGLEYYPLDSEITIDVFENVPEGKDYNEEEI